MFIITKILEYWNIVFPFIKDQWKLILGIIIGFLLCGYCAPIPKPEIKEVIVEKVIIKTNVVKVTEEKKDVLTRSIEEIFRIDGSLEKRTIEEIDENSTVSELRNSVKNEKKDVKVESTIVEKKKPRTAAAGVNFTPSDGSLAVYITAETFRFGFLSLDLGLSVPVITDGVNLERISAEAALRFPLPF